MRNRSNDKCVKNDLSQYIMRFYVEIRNDLYYIDIAKPLQKQKIKT